MVKNMNLFMDNTIKIDDEIDKLCNDFMVKKIKN